MEYRISEKKMDKKLIKNEKFYGLYQKQKKSPFSYQKNVIKIPFITKQTKFTVFIPEI